MREGRATARRSVATRGGAALLGLALGLLVPVALPGATAPAAAAGSGGSSSGTVWLCRPGAADDPCTASLRTTVVTATGSTSVSQPKPAAESPFDCFYVYPTVSTEKRTNANLRVQPAEITTAEAQASPFSQVCRVWAPMYRQVTLAGLSAQLAPGGPAGAAKAARTVAYDSLRSAFLDYLAHDNDGRPIVFLGHSQGAAILILLLRQLVDGDPALRHRLVMAIILGGNVEVRTGGRTGGSFSHIPLCDALGESGCVIAYSSFLEQPPADSLFGRPGQGVSLQSGQTATTGVQVACVDPAALAGGTGDLQPEFPADGTASTPWVSYPGLYTAQCRSQDGATWLQVTKATGPSDRRPVVSQIDGPQWGLHVYDVNLAMGNLVADVRAAEQHWPHR